MCGIAGIFSLDGSNQNLNEIASGMANKLLHRGPDNVGAWSNKGKTISLTHTRLSILDLSHLGNQPMCSPSGRYTIVFNGEIYNHLKLRKMMNFSNWQGMSDTETLLAAFEEWGIDSTLKRAVGMFAFGLWDNHRDELILGRDRVGEKPIYYGMDNGLFVFASELKAFKTIKNWELEINRDVLPLYFRHGYVPTPYSIWKNIRKLLPGTSLTIKKEHNHLGNLHPVNFWSLDGISNDAGYKYENDKDAINELDRLLNQSIEEQSISDVPIGSFLSGGIDSSLISAIMQTQSSKSIETFSIGFKSSDFDESVFAKDIANFIGSKHTEIIFEQKDIADLVVSLPIIYDEPFADSSQIPTMMLSNVAKKQVSVCLTGDGGDELFGGYNRHFFAVKIYNKISFLPKSIRVLLANSIRMVVNCRLGPILKIFPNMKDVPHLENKLYKIANLVESRDLEDVYLKLTSVNLNPEFMADCEQKLQTHMETERNRLFNQDDFSVEDWFMVSDFLGYLTDDILVKVDRASMQTSLETRTPFLHSEIINFSRKIPLSMKLRDNRGKWIVREVLNNYVTNNLFERPKHGFGIPVGELLRTDLRDWAEDLIFESIKSNSNPNFKKYILQKWRQHITCSLDHSHSIWPILIFESWREEWT